MMPADRHQKYLYISLVSHAVILLAFIISFSSTSTMPVFENTNKNDVISAVILGDTPTSKIIPQKIAADEPKPLPVPIPETKPAPTPKVAVDKDAIALKIIDNKKKLAQQKAEEAKKARDLLAKNLLDDIKKTTVKQKKVKQQALQNNFQKMLKQQAEKSLRQQLLNEEIKLQGNEIRQSHGVVDKYKALIIQAISARWIVPTQSRKNIYSELMIRIAPGGVVLDVQVTKSSGDSALDSSARAAVLQASPLPVPSDPNQFEPFRQFILKVKPENIIPS